MKKKYFLLEIRTEELPAKKLYKIAKNFYKKTIKICKTLKIKYKKILFFASYRRIAINIHIINILKKKFLFKLAYKSLHNINYAKYMTWGKGKIRFIRPIHTLIILLDNKIIPGKILGIKSNKFTTGNRFIGKKKLLLIMPKIIQIYFLIKEK